MKHKLRLLCASLIALAALTLTASAADIGLFPVPYTAQDGSTRWGYMDAAGEQQIGPFYAGAGVFQECGLASVQTAQGETALINQAGDVVAGPVPSPLSVEFGTDSIAFRYGDRTVFYSPAGAELGEYRETPGFFSDGLLRAEQNGLWGYLDENGAWAIAPTYAEAGDFVDGRALAKTTDGAFALLGRSGEAAALPAAPAFLAIGPDGTAVLTGEDGARLYSLETGEYLTGPVTEIQPFSDDRCAVFLQGAQYGIMTASGRVAVEPQFYSLSYMGGGIYAARGEDGSVRAIRSDGIEIYRTAAYVGGFESFRFGLSWHGTLDGGVRFFDDDGTLNRLLANAASPEIVCPDVAAVTLDGKRAFIRLSDGETLYTVSRTYTLDGGVTVSTRQYEKYFGMPGSAAGYGWTLTYPQFSGMKDTEVQKKINSAIEKFFLDGAQTVGRRNAMEGSYGFGFYGRVLVVWADARVGTGAGATIWNDNVALDYASGRQYSVEDDLLTGDYRSVLAAHLDGSYYAYAYPRIGNDCILLYRNSPATKDAPASAQEVRIPLSAIWPVVNTQGECYQALTLVAAATPAVSVRFTDVPEGHWAYAAVESAAARGLMQGEGTLFRPDDSISMAEAATSLVRGLGLPAGGTAPGLDPAAWYAPSIGALYDAGLLSGLENLPPEQAVSRADAMQLIANILRRDGGAPLSETQITATLAPFPDGASVPAARREAAAYCIQAGVISGGEGGLLLPAGTFTRAEFAKLLTAVLPAEES